MGVNSAARVQHGGMRRAVGVASVVLAAALGGGVVVAVSGTAAAGCAARITFNGPSGSKLEASPSSVSVAVKECVQFTNSTSDTLSVTVTQGGRTVYSTAIAKGATVSSAHAFVPKSTGRASVAASEKTGLLGLGKASGSASVTVTSPPSPKPSKSKSTKPKPTPKHSSRKPGKKPDVAKSPKHGQKGKKGKHTPGPHATGIKLPPLPPLPTTEVTAPLPKASRPLVASGPTTARPVTTESTTPVAAVIAGPIEPAEEDSRGLPIAIGVLIILGLASGWGRVLLATSAVDSPPRRNRRA
jgi:hypothetical protein